MFRKCCICKTARLDATLHRFPSNAKRLQKWLKHVNRDDLYNLPSKRLTNLFVCHLHFEDRFISRSQSHLLSKAYPSLFTKEEISSGVPSINQENVDPLPDHNYYKRNIHNDHNYYQQEPLKDVTSDTRELRYIPAASRNPPHSTPQEIEGSTSSNIQCMPESSQVCDVNINSPHILKRETSLCSGDENNQCDRLEHSEETTIETRESLVPNTESPSISSTHCQDENTSEFTGNVTVPVVRKRLLQKVKDLTPTGKLIYKELLKAKRQLEFQRKERKARRAKYTKEKLFEMFTKNMNPLAKKIINMQVNLCNRKTRGRRFTDEEKLLALSLYKQNPKCYEMLQRIFILPWKPTLIKTELKLIEETGKQFEENLNDEQNHSEELN